MPETRTIANFDTDKWIAATEIPLASHNAHVHTYYEFLERWSGPQGSGPHTGFQITEINQQLFEFYKECYKYSRDYLQEEDDAQLYLYLAYDLCFGEHGDDYATALAPVGLIGFNPLEKIS